MTKIKLRLFIGGMVIFIVFICPILSWILVEWLEIWLKFLGIQ